jgi:hypothetical protein
VAAVIRVNHLQRANMRPEQLNGDRQVSGWLCHLRDLNERPIHQFDLLPGPGCGGMQQVRGHAVQQIRGPASRQAGSHQFGLPERRQPNRVRPRRVNPVPPDILDGPAVPGDDPSHMVEVISSRGARMIACPAHDGLLRIVGCPSLSREAPTTPGAARVPSCHCQPLRRSAAFGKPG